LFLVINFAVKLQKNYKLPKKTSKKLQLVIILAENRKKTKGMPSSTGSYKTKEMGALARLPLY
jgi:hypothetical protein